MQCYKVVKGGVQVAFKYSSEQEALIFPRQGRRQATAAAADKDMVVACMRCVSVARAVMWSGEDRCSWSCFMHLLRPTRTDLCCLPVPDHKPDVTFFFILDTLDESPNKITREILSLKIIIYLVLLIIAPILSVPG